MTLFQLIDEGLVGSLFENLAILFAFNMSEMSVIETIRDYRDVLGTISLITKFRNYL